MITPTDDMQRGEELSNDLTPNLERIYQAFGESRDLIIKRLSILDGTKAALVYFDGLVDTQLLHQFVLEALMHTRPQAGKASVEVFSGKFRYLSEEVLTVGQTHVVNTLEPLFTCLLSGECILLLEQENVALAIGISGGEERALAEPTSQSVVRGPMDAFTEKLATNIPLVRRRIKDPNLWIESYFIGTVTRTEVAVLFMNSCVRPEVLDEVRRRLKDINIDGILESGYIEEYIQDTALTPFPTVYNTDRPDSVAAALLEGRVAIMVDGTPFVLLVPALFIQFFQSAEDYYQRSDISSLLRIVRLSALFISMLIPSLYIAFTTFHQEMLPTGMLISLAAQREGVPFPAFVEAILMEFVYEILREAGVRIPRNVGQAVSIVGTLVIGQAAVEAGIISAAMVIIVSITAISSFVIPAVSMSISVRMIRFVMMGLAGGFGLIGLFFGVVVLMLHLTSLRSFGASYMSPFSPSPEEEWKDTIFRMPWPYLNKRPSTADPRNARRQSPAAKEDNV